MNWIIWIGQLDANNNILGYTVYSSIVGDYTEAQDQINTFATYQSLPFMAQTSDPNCYVCLYSGN